jgi:threonine aldolase
VTRPAGFPNQTRHLVDLRSDTVTRPTEEMFEAMRQAPLGDDVLGDDPTVMRLEELAAETLGKEQAVFVPSGTMGNQCALASHCSPGDAILVEEDAHILYYEVGGPALIAGVVSWTLPSKHGVMDPDVIEKRVLKHSIHTPGTAVLCLENTHNRAGGTVVPLDHMRAYRELADRHGMKIHLDGARVFNAAAFLGVAVAEIAENVDSVTFCLSKALRAPIGSVLCGDEAFIERARLWRKRLGGGMRQAGLLAACGIVSLTRMVDRLGEDHARASRLAEALDEMPGLQVNRETVQTNIVIVETKKPAEAWQQRLEADGVLCFAFGDHRLRLVLHADIDDGKLERAIKAFGKS